MYTANAIKPPPSSLTTDTSTPIRKLYKRFSGVYACKAPFKSLQERNERGVGFVQDAPVSTVVLASFAWIAPSLVVWAKAKKLASNERAAKWTINSLNQTKV